MITNPKFDINKINIGDIVKWKDLGETIWKSEVSDVNLKLGSVTVDYVNSSIILLSHRILDWYTRESHPEEYL